MTCTHPETRTIATRGYTGSVSRDENRAAHGGTCDIAWLEAAREARQAVIEAERAEEEVA